MAPEINSQRGRLLWVDNLKTLGIVLVVFAHNKINLSAIQLIYAFHLPLFFFLSGVLYNGEKYGFVDFVKRKFHARIKPYFILSAVTYLFWVAVVIPLSVRGEAHGVDKLSAFVGIFYGIGEGVWRNQMAVALWFLPCLFCVEVIYHGLARKVGYSRVKIAGGVFLIVSLGVMLNIFHIPSWRMPWSLDMALIAIVFYAGGHVLSDLWLKIPSLRFSWSMILTAVALLGLGVVLCDLNSRIDMSSYKIRNPLLFIATPFFFIAPLIYILRNARIPGFSFLGQNTLPILAYHFIALFFIRSVFYLLTGNLQPFDSLTIGMNIILVAVEFMVLYPFIIIHNKVLGRFMA